MAAVAAKIAPEVVVANNEQGIGRPVKAPVVLAAATGDEGNHDMLVEAAVTQGYYTGRNQAILDLSAALAKPHDARMATLRNIR